MVLMLRQYLFLCYSRIHNGESLRRCSHKVHRDRYSVKSVDLTNKDLFHSGSIHNPSIVHYHHNENNYMGNSHTANGKGYIQSSIEEKQLKWNKNRISIRPNLILVIMGET